MTADPKPVPSLIAIDWGTTNRRAYLLNHEGIILDSYVDGDGLTNIRDGAYEASLKVLAAPWVAQWGSLPILMSGMIGASTGWLDAGYCLVPVDSEGLSKELVCVSKEKNIWIVPGVRTTDSSGNPDVIRGEEVQSLAIGGYSDQLMVVAPGTHSKWIHIQDKSITGFTTFLTGDLFDAVLNHTIISVLNDQAHVMNDDAFYRGVRAGFSEYQNLMHTLFSARTNVLFKNLLPTEVSDYLSGLLIGGEIGSGLSEVGMTDAVFVLIGASDLTERYKLAFGACEITAEIMNTDTVGKVYSGIARSAGLVR